MVEDEFSSAYEALPPGAHVGEYVVSGLIGEGTYGMVYRAEHELIGKVAAVKVLHQRYSADPQITKRFMAEARAVNKIGNPNIVDIFAFGSMPNGQYYLVMELLEGETLGEKLAREGRLHAQETISVLRPVAEALDAAHAAGIAHRDLKPENIFLSYGSDGLVNGVKLLDFGVAKLQDDRLRIKTATGVTIGTPLYMSTEQVRIMKVTAKTDLYALGTVIYEALTGEPVFNDETIVEVMMHHVSTPPRPPSDVLPTLSPELDAPILHLLAKAPSSRPTGAVAAMDALALAHERASTAGPKPV
ncbi:MAG: serine/threonine-protein kinase, partial [Myxococcota bacterium]